MGGVGMAEAVAERLPHDVQDFSLFFLGQHLDCRRLKIQSDLHQADLFIGSLHGAELFRQIELRHRILIEPMHHPADLVDQLVDLVHDQLV
jgi:hypothetical protein